MKKRIFALILIMFMLLSACDSSITGQQLGKEKEQYVDILEENNSKSSTITVGYNLFHDEYLCDTIRFIDGDAKGYNNYIDGEPVRMLNNCLVYVLVTFQFDHEKWSLIYSPVMAERCNYYCWVNAEVLKEYDKSTMEERLCWPIHLKEGTIMYDENHEKERVEVQNREYWLSRRNGEFFVEIEGGISCKVKKDDIIFPTVSDKDIVWE